MRMMVTVGTVVARWNGTSKRTGPTTRATDESEESDSGNEADSHRTGGRRGLRRRSLEGALTYEKNLETFSHRSTRALNSLPFRDELYGLATCDPVIYTGLRHVNATVKLFSGMKGLRFSVGCCRWNVGTR